MIFSTPENNDFNDNFTSIDIVDPINEKNLELVESDDKSVRDPLSILDKKENNPSISKNIPSEGISREEPDNPDLNEWLTNAFHKHLEKVLKIH